MLNWILAKVFGTQNERTLRRLWPIVRRVSALEEQVKGLTDGELRLKTDRFRERLAKGETLEDLLPEAFAVCREASRRRIGLRHFDVQILGGIVLHQGKIAEMATGEGKTLVATLPVYLNALTGKGVHVATVNDYLARRDAEWMGPIYHALGLKTAVLNHESAYLYQPKEGGRTKYLGAGEELVPISRKEAYQADVVYVTNHELGFDYLRDNMVLRREDRVQRELNFCIIDEVDSQLIDEAKTPLIISGRSEESSQKYYIADRVARQLKGRRVTEAEEVDAKYKGINLAEGYDYLVDEKNHTVSLTAQGISKCEKLLGLANLYEDASADWVHHIQQALRAHNLFRRETEYIVKDGQVVIVDEFTGRLLPGRRWSEGLHQAVEAKEGLHIAEEQETLASITFQNFFRLYKKLAGMTGTAATEAGEFWEIYKLDVVVIPTNVPCIRKDDPDQVYRTAKEKWDAIVADIAEQHAKGRPILVGTRSIETNEHLSRLLKQKGIPHQILNAKFHEQEAQVIAQAGRPGTVTVATNMAGRGTDIILGGNPPRPDEQAKVKEAGGLYVIGTERHEARRIDNQLRGRCGRQGDPGTTRFYLSLEDELMRLFGSERLQKWMGKLGMREGEVIEHPWVTKAIANAQKKVEQMNFDIRKNLLDYDNVMNVQRQAVYDLRNRILEGEDVSRRIETMIDEWVEETTEMQIPKKRHPSLWPLEAIRREMARQFLLEFPVQNRDLEAAGDPLSALRERMGEKIRKAWRERQEMIGPENFRELERQVLLRAIDFAWKDNLTDLERLRRSVGLRGYGQKDPKIEFKKESYRMFEAMMARIRTETLGFLFRVPLAAEPAVPFRRAAPVGAKARAEEVASAARQRISRGISGARAVAVGKIGRNDPCPCGSGKKYKKCCGR